MNITWTRLDGHGNAAYTKEFDSIQAFEAYFRNAKDPDAPEEIEKICNTCAEYDGNRCMKEWNNLDPSYYRPDRDDKEPDDSCDDWKEGYIL